ncbi:transglutaminase family protein [Corallococcus sicarius]|uniref:transglutaminase family protein n=1 Tax=Corallococcus sicarius TaxID=2316726 RepID=UPI0013157D42|nr:transglutaminase family protein [Corallococcus sicarius]
MKIVFTFIVVLLPLHSRAAPPEAPEVRVARDLLALPEEKLNIGEAALKLGATVDGDTDLAEGLRIVDALATRVQVLVSNRTDADYRIRATNQVLFRVAGYTYDKEDPLGARLDASSLWRLLRTKKGNCVSLPILWYAVAERLGYPVKMVEAPQHFFLRYESGDDRSNIEATSNGAEASDERIVRELSVTPKALKTGAMMRSLTKRELLGALIAETAARQLRDWNIGLGAQLSELALKAYPNSIAAHWNLAIAYNHRASMRNALRTPGEVDVPGGKVQAKEDTRAALAHAEEATRLGAPAPLTRDYWTRVSSIGGTEVGGTRPTPKPFDVASLLRPGGQSIQLTLDAPPALLESARRDPGSCMRICANLCGPSPGNRCANF